MKRLVKNAWARESDKVLDNYTMTLLWTKCLCGDEIGGRKTLKSINKSAFHDAIYKAVSIFVQHFIDKNINAARKVIARWIRTENIHIDPTTMDGEEMSNALLSHLEKNSDEVTVQKLAACFDDNALDDLFRMFMQILMGTSGYTITSMNTKMGKSFLHYISSYPLTSKAFLSFIKKMAKSDDSFIPPFYIPELYDASRVDKEGKEKFDDEKDRQTFYENRERLIKKHDVLTDRGNKDVDLNVKIDSSGTKLKHRSEDWRRRPDDEWYPDMVDAAMQEDVPFAQAIFSNYPTKMSNDNAIAIINGDVKSAEGDPSANVKAWININHKEPDWFVAGFLTPNKKVLFVSEFKGSINWADIKTKLSLMKIYQLYDKNIVSKRLVKTRRLAKKI